MDYIFQSGMAHIQQPTTICMVSRPGAHPTSGISIEFEIRSKLGVLWFKICPADHNENVYTSRQCKCREQNFVVIRRICYEQEHFKVSLKFEFDRNIVSGTGAWYVLLRFKFVHWCTSSTKYNPGTTAPIKKSSALVKVMAWRQASDRPLC